MGEWNESGRNMREEWKERNEGKGERGELKRKGSERGLRQITRGREAREE